MAVLEEPEHLNWYHHGTRWTDKFNHVVGVMHTNYIDYARREENGALKEIAVGTLNQIVTRLHCDKVRSGLRTVGFEDIADPCNAYKGCDRVLCVS